MAGPNARVLSYHDILLRQGDVDLLAGPECWLNDQLIAFYFTYLVEAKYPGLALCLMPPGSSYLLVNSDPSEAALIFSELQLRNKELVVFAVTDNPDVEHANGGSHWSCLCYHRPTNTFRHYDSAGSSRNTSVARELAGAASPLVRSRSSSSTNGGGSGGGSTGAAIQQPAFVKVAAMPSQRNGHDCGLYVCAVADALCSLTAKQHLHEQQQQQGEQQFQDAAGQHGSAATSATEAVAPAPATAAAACADGGAGRSSGSAAATDADFEQQEQEALQLITSQSVVLLRQEMRQLVFELAAKCQKRHKQSADTAV